MDPISLLRSKDFADLTPAEEAALTRELADAYHMDEAAVASRDVQRIAEKIRVRLLAARDADPANPPPLP